jgi:hypothetical protein
MDTIGPMSYCGLNGMLDAAFPKGAFHYWKSNFLKRLDDDAIDTMADCFSRCPAPMSTFFFEHVHGAVTRVPVEATAFPHRAEGHSFLILAQWMDPALTECSIAWARQTYSAVEPFLTSGRYVNYMSEDDSGEAAAAGAYGPNYPRLRALKAKYDPGNFFHMNQNIRPA